MFYTRKFPVCLLLRASVFASVSAQENPFRSLKHSRLTPSFILCISWPQMHSKDVTSVPKVIKLPPSQ